MDRYTIILIFECFLFGTIIVDHFESTINKRFNMGSMVDNSPYNASFVYHKEAVATDVELCSKIGWKMLHQNGTAVDGAIAALLCLGVTNPHSSGIGGGGFMLLHFPSKNSTELIDFREEAPACSSPHMINNGNDIYSGGLSVAVPGELKGMELAWKKYGKLKWKTLFEPSIRIAQQGFSVGAALSLAIDKWKTDILSEPTLKQMFTINGKLATEGSKLRNTKLAKFLRLIANSNSSDIFYSDTVAKKIEEEVKKFNGCLTGEDILSYKAKVRDAIHFPVKNLDVVTGPAPTSGPILALMLKIFLKSNLTRKELKSNAPLVYHTLIEAMKHGYGMRTLLADPDFESSVNEITDDILETDLADALYKQIGYKTHGIKHYLVNGSVPFKTGTTHLVIVDKWGNCVSVTSTINGYFGAKFSSKTYGFIYNNEMDDFSFPHIFNEYNLPPSMVNYPVKGKRPQSSSLPVMVIDEHNQVVFSAGGSGGSMITSAVAQVLIYHLIMGFNLKDAMDSPRLHNQVTPDIVYAESRFPEDILVELTRFNHKVEKNNIHHAVVQAISRHNGSDFINYVSRRKHVHSLDTIIYAESDFRKGGKPYGI